MKYSVSTLGNTLCAFGVVLICAILVLVSGAIASRAAAQTFDFNAGTDTGWTRYELPAYGAPTFSFPPDDSAGKAYKIFAPPTGDDPGGMRNARAGSYRTDVTYTGRMSIGTDLLSWNAAWRQESGMLFYLASPGLGTSSGYSATYSSGYRTLYLSSIAYEVDTTVAELGSGAITLDPAHRYRLVASTHDGSTFLFQLFDKADLDSPLCSAIGQDFTYTSGYGGLFVFEQTYPSATEGAEATFDNYAATVPAAGEMPATLTDLTPPPGAGASAVYPTVTACILDRDTMVDTTTILLSLDGAWVPNALLTIDPQVHKPRNPSSGLRDFSGATVTYTITNLFPWGSKHTNSIVFRDFSNAWRTNSWEWTTAYPHLFASNSLPLGSLSVRGFDVRMAQSDNGCVNLENSLARARQQLAIPAQIAVDRAATSIVQMLSWDKTSDPSTLNNVPGLCASGANPACGSYNNIAVESFGYLELTAGVHRFRIDSDDRAGLYSGAGLFDANALTLWENPDTTANATFDIVVEAAGLYPVRCLWEETGGGAHLYLNSIKVEDATETPVNDPANPPGVVKAWYPLVCRSAAAVTGPYSVEGTAVNVLNTVPLVGADCGPTVVGQTVSGGTFTVSIPASTRFYRLEGPRATRITGIVKSGSSLLISYQMSPN